MGSEAAVWRDTMHALWRRWWIIAIGGVIGLVVGLVFAVVQPTRWTATSQLVLAPVAAPALLGETGIADNSDRAGVLGLDLPAETQARAMSAPALLRIVAQNLGFSNIPRAMAAFVEATRVEAVTDNAYLITTEGPTADEASARANEIGKMYLAQRNAVANQVLTRLAVSADEQSRRAVEQAAGLQRAINQTARAPQSGALGSLIDRQIELQTEARTRADRATSLRNAAQLVGSGSQIVSPATGKNAIRSPKIFRDAAFGLILGLLAGVLGLLGRHHLSPRVGNRDDIAKAAGAAVLAAHERPRRQADPDPARTALGVGVLAGVSGQHPGWRRLLVLGLGELGEVETLARSIATASAEQGLPTVLVSTSAPAAPGYAQFAETSVRDQGTDQQWAGPGPNSAADDRRREHQARIGASLTDTRAGAGGRLGPPMTSRSSAETPAANVVSAGTVVRPSAKSADAGNTGQPPPPIGRDLQGADAVRELLAVPAAQRPALVRQLLRPMPSSGPLHELAVGGGAPPARAAAVLAGVLDALDERVVIGGWSEGSSVGLLAGGCDAVVLLVRSGRDNRAAVGRLAQRVRLAGTEVLGVAVTDADPGDSSLGMVAAPTTSRAVEAVEAEPVSQ